MRILSKLMSVFVILLATISYTANATLILEWDNTSTSSNSTHTGASAKLTMDFFQDSGNFILINMLVENTTHLTTFGDGATSSMLTGIAFDLIDAKAPLSTPILGDFNSGVDEGKYLDTMLTSVASNPFPTLDFGIADGTNFGGGNANGALPASTEDMLSIKIDFGGYSASEVESAFSSGFTDDSLNYVARFQQVNAGAGSDKLSGGTCCGGDDGGGVQDIPEPDSLFLFAVALLAVLYCNKYTFK